MDPLDDLDRDLCGWMKNLWGVPQRFFNSLSAAIEEMVAFCISLIIGGRR